MNFKKWISVTAASIFLAGSFTVTSVANAEETKTIADESIYDLLVDRYFNASAQNDYHANPKDPAEFAGGDFKGIIEKYSVIKKMGFTIVSLGPVFSSEKYDGSMVTSYSKFERHFGTAEDFKKLVKTLNKDNLSVMVDFPLTNVSANHEWAQDSTKKQWVVGTANGKVRWDLKNPEVQKALIDSVVHFVSTYKVDGIRLTNLDIADTSFLNEMIKSIKDVNENIYVISNEDSKANFDATFYNETNETFHKAYKNVDIDSSNLLKNAESFVKHKDVPTQLMVDNIHTNRFIYDAETFYPTRLKLAMSAVLLLPGVPVMQYGTEIAMNGEVGPESHQLYNFRTDEELVDFIKNIQTLRNQSETLRKGDFRLIKNENGFLVFERSSDKEKWVVVINNTGKTTRVNLTEEEIGINKELHGMLDGDTIRENDKGIYPVVLDREMIEIFQVTEKRGFNVSYLVALALVYIVFITFIIVLMKRGKRKRAQENN